MDKYILLGNAIEKYSTPSAYEILPPVDKENFSNVEMQIYSLLRQMSEVLKKDDYGFTSEKKEEYLRTIFSDEASIQTMLTATNFAQIRDNLALGLNEQPLLDNNFMKAVKTEILTNTDSIIVEGGNNLGNILNLAAIYSNSQTLQEYQNMMMTSGNSMRR